MQNSNKEQNIGVIEENREMIDLSQMERSPGSLEGGKGEVK